MKSNRKFIAAGVVLGLFGMLIWLVWYYQPAIEARVEAVDEANSAVLERPAAAVPTATWTPRPTNTSIPTLFPTAEPAATLTPTPTPTETSIPTSTPTSEPTETATATATESSFVAADGVDRTCPNPAPLRPDYDRYYVPARSWPEAMGSEPGHFWLAHPFAGGGRLLYTDWFPYGYDAGGRYLIHNGLDVAEPLGTPILAMAAGTVVTAGDDFGRLYGWRCDWYGHLVVIELDQQWLGRPVYVLYGHVLGITVEVGQQVSQGEQVAEVGVGGAATLPHLHIEVRVGTNEFGSTRNPLLWVRPWTTRGLIVGRVVDPEGRPWQGVAINAIGKSEETENYTTWSYLGDPQNLINPDEVLAENFVFGDVRPGRYEIYVLLQGVEYKAEVEVVAGEMATVEIVTEPLKMETPEPAPGETSDGEENPIEADGEPTY